MTNIRPAEELIVHFDRHVSYGLWRSILNKAVDEADRLGFDLSKEDGGLEDPLSALHRFSVVICRARLEYLSPFRKGSYYRKSLQGALLDGWADRLRDDVLLAWRQALEKAQLRQAPPFSTRTRVPAAHFGRTEVSIESFLLDLHFYRYAFCSCVDR